MFSFLPATVNCSNHRVKNRKKNKTLILENMYRGYYLNNKEQKTYFPAISFDFFKQITLLSSVYLLSAAFLSLLKQVAGLLLLCLKFCSLPYFLVRNKQN